MSPTPREIDDRTLRQIVAGTAATAGEDFFDELVRRLAGALATRCAWVTEWLPDERKLRAISFWAGDRHVGDYVYDVAGTPCERVVAGGERLLVPDRLIDLYPDDPDLAPLHAVSYLGVPLTDTDGSVLGHLAVMDDGPLSDDPRLAGVFDIFAGRAAAELRRLRRERDLAEREQHLAGLVGSAMDAIVELDGSLAIRRMNPAAERTFACRSADAAGRTFDAFLSEESRARLRPLVAELDGRSDAPACLWIPDGLEALRHDGTPFTAEASLSRFVVRDRPFYTLILRDVDERVRAEQRIRALVQETRDLRAEIGALSGFDAIEGRSEALARVLADVDLVAATDTTVLVLGETGTGKELVVRALHERSPRAPGPFVRMNCAAIPANLLESELFGHVKGAFTGATQDRDGRFKLAGGGTLFLDEVGELPLDLQAKLLRVLQEGEFEPLGSARTERADVRVVAATNRDLRRMVADGTFREDLLYRLEVFPLELPPLRERGDDVVLLAESFAAALAKRSGRTVAPLTKRDKARLKSYAWPGNVRELRNVVERAFITSRDGRTLNLDRALPEGSDNAARPRSPREAPDGRVLTVDELRELERRNVVRALETAGWKISGRGGAAGLLGMNPNTLTSRMKALGISRPGRGARARDLS